MPSSNVFLISFFAVLTMYSHLSLFADHEVTDKQYERYVNEFASSFKEQMQKELNIQLNMPGGAFHDYLDGGMNFSVFRRATLEEARALQVAVMEKLVEAIRANQNIFPYFQQSSLTPETIGTAIYFVDADGRRYGDGSVESVVAALAYNDDDSVRRDLLYRFTDPFGDSLDNDDEIVESYFRESYQDAVRLTMGLTDVNPAIHELKEFEKELDQIFIKFEKQILNKYKLHLKSIGWMLSGKPTSDISEIRLKCELRHPGSLGAARSLILGVTEQLLDAINTSETLRPYLKEYPFPSSRLKLRIVFRRDKFFVGYVPYYDGTVESVVLDRNALTYYHYVPSREHDDRHDRVLYAKESYELATQEASVPPTMMERVSEGMSEIAYQLKSIITTSLYLLIIGLFFAPWGSILLVIVPLVICLIGLATKK